VHSIWGCSKARPIRSVQIPLENGLQDQENGQQPDKLEITDFYHIGANIISQDHHLQKTGRSGRQQAGAGIPLGHYWYEFEGASTGEGTLRLLFRYLCCCIQFSMPPAAIMLRCRGVRVSLAANSSPVVRFLICTCSAPLSTAPLISFISSLCPWASRS